MDFGMQLGQGQRLEQNISPQMLQSIAILQKNALELDTAIKEEIEANPLLELDESVHDDMALGSSESGESENDLDEPLRNSDGESREEMDFERGTLEDSADLDYDILDNTSSEDWVKRLEDGSNDTDAPFKDLNSVAADSDEVWDRPQKDRGESLQDSLRNQLRDWNGTRELLGQLNESGCSVQRFRELVQYLIDCLDERGYLQGADEIAMTKVLADNDRFIVEIERFIRNEISLETVSLPVAEAIHVLQSFKPRGIGARNLQECFLIQAQSIRDFPPLAIRILKDHFEDLQALRYAKIAKDASSSIDVVQHAVNSLSRLVPHPGLQVSSSPAQVRVPDMSVAIKKGKCEVECFKTPLQKRLRINKMYARMLDDKHLSKTDREFIQEKLNKANEFMKSVDNRYSTMEQVMHAIVKHQRDFFKKGPAFLKPMILQDIADEVDRDLSTVSRVANGKYVETPFGIFELKQFFTSGVRQGDSGQGDVVGSAQILDAIKALVDAEDKKKPLSDQAIADALEAQGIKVARRTVAKYREEKLKILPASARKNRLF